MKPKVVLVTGVFDVIHGEHVKFLKKAKQLGDKLVVALESDYRVKKLKGKDRPINSQKIRKNNLEKLKLADKVMILPEKFDTPEDHLKFLRLIKPDILAVSSHTAHQKQKRHLMQMIGGELVVAHQHNPEISTTKLIKTGQIRVKPKS